MKKKMTIAVLLIAILCCLMFTSCSFIKLNEERVANAVISTVSYDYAGNQNFPAQKLELTVTRSELVSYVNYIIYLYSNYGMSYNAADIFEQSIDSLGNQKYQILKGMEYLMDNASPQRLAAMYYFTDEYKAIYGDKITAEGILTQAERLSIISTTNETFVSNIGELIADYNNEIREREITSAKENLLAKYSAGYSVAEEDGVIYAHVTGTDEFGSKVFADGLYVTELSSDNATIDYEQVYLKITLVKSGEDNAVIYLPAASDAIASADDPDSVSSNTHITNKAASTDYEEPITTTKEVTDEKTGKTTTEEVSSTKTHTAVSYYKVITPRTALPEETDTATEDKEAALEKYRYNVSFNLTDAEQKEFVESGSIFAIYAASDANDAEKDAYRQFRETKKNALIGFDVEEKVYNGLGYYYKSSFESGVLTAVQYEIKQKALAQSPTTEADLLKQYTVLAAKQKGEYDILPSYKDQVNKFATLIGTDLSSCYYIPLEALTNTTYTYTDSEGNEVTRAYATLNDNGTYTIDMFYITHILFKFDAKTSALIAALTADIPADDADALKNEKLNLILSVGLLNTNKSNENYVENGGGDKLSDAYYVVLDSEGNPKLYNDEGKELTLEEQFLTEKVKDVYAALVEEISEAADDNERLEIFKKYMIWYNDDNGAMSSKLGYFIAMGDIAHSYDGDDFPNAGKAIYTDLIEDGVISEHLKTAFTSYGLHAETISFMPFYKIALTQLSEGLWVLGIDKELDLSGETTFRTTIAESLESTVNTNAYSAWTKSITSEEAAEHTVKNTKSIKKLAKALGV